MTPNGLSTDAPSDQCPTLWLLVGLPGCGKTTYSKKLWQHDSAHTVRVCLDEIIQMVSFYSYDRQLRTFYGEFEYRTIITALIKGYQVIVDRTNLTPTVRGRFLAVKNRVQALAQNFQKTLEQHGGDIQVLAKLISSRMGYAEEEPIDFYHDAFFNLITQKDLFVPGFFIPQHLERLAKIRSVAIFFDISPEVALARRLADPLNSLRDMTRRNDWNEVLQRMQGELQPPTLDEGFDEIITLDANGCEVKTENSSKPAS